MKVVILHPPLYPMNHDFFNLLGKKVNLTVIQFGNAPGLHKNWNINKIQNTKNYNLILIEGFTDLKKYAVSYKTQMSLKWIKEIKRIQPNIVISIAFWIPSLYASFLKKIFHYDFFILTDAIEHTEKKHSIVRKIIRKITVKNVDGFIVGSCLTKQYLNQVYPNIDIFESYNSIDVQEWIKKMDFLPEKETLRRQLNIHEGRIVLLGVGNFTKLKNWEKVIKNMKQLNSFYFILIGNGELRDVYLKIIEELNISNIEIIERKEKDELKEYFKLSDVFIFPTMKDTFGYVVMEALASSLPVLCSKNSGASCLITNSFNGYIFNPKEDIVEALKLIENDINKLQSNALESVKNIIL